MYTEKYDLDNRRSAACGQSHEPGLVYILTFVEKECFFEDTCQQAFEETLDV